MNRPWPRRIFWHVHVLFWMACGGGVDDPNAPCAQELSQRMRYDCEQTIECKVRLGDLPRSNDSVQQCLDTSNQVVSTTAARTQFLTTYGRCSRLTLCDYANCAQAGAHGYGEMQRAAVTYNCQQTMACNAVGGAQVCDGAQALQDCISITTGLLDSLSPNDQLGFQSAHARCAALAGCDFVNCIRQGV